MQYNTYSTHYKETDCLREMVEPFMYNVGVDIVLHGEHTVLEQNTFPPSFSHCAWQCVHR